MARPLHSMHSACTLRVICGTCLGVFAGEQDDYKSMVDCQKPQARLSEKTFASIQDAGSKLVLKLCSSAAQAVLKRCVVSCGVLLEALTRSSSERKR